MKIELAKPSDAEAITALTLRSKAFWNYTVEQIESWTEDLTIGPEYIQSNYVYKLSDTDQQLLIGFYAYDELDDKKVKLNFLFIDPKFIGKGYGKILIDNFIKRIKQTQFNIVTLDADPNAEAFYLKHGFKVVGQLPSSIKDRYLPVMELKL